MPMNLTQTMEKIAGREMTDDEAMQFCKDQWGRVVTWLHENDHERTGYFPITSVHRNDLTGIGYLGHKVDDGTMLQLASKMADAYCDNGFWIALPIIADHLEIPKKKDHE